MATVVNDRDIQLESISPRLAGVSLTANVTVTQDQVDGLGLILSGTKGISLLTTTQVIQVQTDGSETPSSVTLTANLQNITATPTLTIVSGSGTMSVTPALTAGVFSFTPAQLTSDSITFHLEVTDGGTTYSDDMTVLKVYQGSDGLNALLTNETVTLPADYLGNVTSYAPAAGNFKVYHGTTDVTSVCTFSIPTGGNTDSLTYSLTTTGTGAGAYAVTAGIPSGHDFSSLTIRATFGTTTIDKVFTMSKAKTGTPGTNGTSGTSGSRGSVTLYAGLTGTTATWSDTTAASAVTSYTGTAPIRLDTVTEYNNSQSFSVTKFYDGTAWQTISAVVNGNLLVTGTVAGSALVANTVDATKIDSRGLTIKDSAGNVIFSAGSPLGNDAATSLGFNPTFSAWSSTYPDHWVIWAGSAPIKVTTPVLTGAPYSVKWVTTGTDLGMVAQFNYPAAAPLPAGSYLTGSASIYMIQNSGGGPPGYLVRCFTNSALSTFVDNYVLIPNQTVSGWQRFPFTATAGGATIYAVTIYQMACWSGFPGGNSNGNIMAFGPFTFDIQKPTDSAQVIPAAGWLNSNVTPSSINAVGSGNPITSGNITTFIASAAIGQTQIGTAAIGTLQVQDAAITTAKIVDLRTTNYAEDGSGNPTAGAKLASAGTALKVANSSLQVGTVIFTDYWTRLVQGIDGAAGTAIIWRGNNDATTRGGAPNIDCLTVATGADQTVSSNFQQTYMSYTLTPTTYTTYSDNLDAMTHIHFQFFDAVSSSAPFTECYLPCPSRTYDGASGIAIGSLHWGWRYAGTGAQASGLHETNNSYNAYVRVRIANTYGFSATKDLYGGGSSASVGRTMTATTITGVAGSSGGGGGGSGGACPAPWVKVALHNGKLVDASDLFDGSVIAAVNDSTMQPMPKGAIVRRPAVIWKKRLQVTLTDGRKTEWSYGHRFCLVGGEWVAIQDLRPGDHIMGPVENIVESITPTGEGPVVSFQVEGAGTYFAGDMLSHNNKLIP